MEFSPPELEALRSLIEDEEGALSDLEQEIDDRSLELYKLRVRDIVFGPSDLHDVEKRSMHE